MDSARNQFLTCSRFAEDQDGRIGFGNRAHLLEDLNTALVWLFSPVRNLQGAGHRSILAFANDLCGEDSGKRIFPIIGVGSSLGAWVGARMAAHLFKQMDAYALMLVAMAGLLLSIVLVRMADARRKRSDDLPSKPLRRNGGFGLVRSNRYLLLIALMVLTFNLVNSLGEYILGQIDVADAKAAVAAGVITSSQMRSAIGAFYGDFFGWVTGKLLIP